MNSLRWKCPQYTAANPPGLRMRKIVSAKGLRRSSCSFNHGGSETKADRARGDQGPELAEIPVVDLEVLG